MVCEHDLTLFAAAASPERVLDVVDDHNAQYAMSPNPIALSFAAHRLVEKLGVECQ
jgi:hypothetical protein